MQDIEKIIEEAKRLQFQGDEGDNRNELRRLFGLEGDGYGISYSPEILECVLSKAKNVMARGNKIVLSSALDGALWFNAVCTAGYEHSSSSAPSVFGTIFRSRKEALSDAVAEFGDRLGDFPQNTPGEINWKKMYADERKKQATMLAKICDREAHFAQVQDVVDEARLTSMKHPETVWLAVDTSDNPRVTDIEEWRSILPKGRASFALYAAWRGRLRLPKKELLALLALPPEDAQGIETSEEAAPAALEEGAAHGATEPGAA